jgi:uncharacterized membrane protein
VTRVVSIVKKAPFPLVFAIVALPVGTFLVFAQPPGQGIDETAHFYRVWTLAHGTIVAPTVHNRTGGYIPQCLLDYFNRFSAEAARRGPFSVSQYWRSPTRCSSQTVFTGFPGAAVYSPVAYIPSLIAVGILHGIGLSLPVVFFAGRLASLLVFIGLFTLAIRITPVGKQVFFVIGLLPTTLLLASSYSADPMTIALAALAVALTLRCCLSTEGNLPEFLLLCLVLLGLGLTKNTFFVFGALLLLVPGSVVGRRHALAIKVVATVVVMGCAGLWDLAVRTVLAVPVSAYGINPHAQIQYILHHPVGYLEVLARTFFESTGEQRWIPGTFFSIGYYRPFGADNIYAPVGLVIVGSLTLWYAYRLQFGPKRMLERGRRAGLWLPIALTLVGVLLIETTLFIYGTPSGLPEINVQGRYFYPLFLLPLVSIGLWRGPHVVRHSIRWIFLGSGVMVVWLLLKVFVHDYSL